MEITREDIESRMSEKTSEETAAMSDEVSSTISSVVEGIEMVNSLCGVDVTMDFLNELNLILRGHYHMYRIYLDRQREVAQVMNAKKVRDMAAIYSAENPILPTQRTVANKETSPKPTTSSSSSSPSSSSSSLIQEKKEEEKKEEEKKEEKETSHNSTPKIEQKVTTTSSSSSTSSVSAEKKSTTSSSSSSSANPPAFYEEIRNLRRQGLVSAIDSSFRSRLESIVASPLATPVGARTHITSTSISTIQERQQQSQQQQQIPLPPPATFLVPNTVPITPTVPQRSSEQQQQVQQQEQVRVPDNAYFDQLLPPVVATTPESTMDELANLVDHRVTSRILSSQFRNHLEHFLQQHIESRNVPRNTNPIRSLFGRRRRTTSNQNDVNRPVSPPVVRNNTPVSPPVAPAPPRNLSRSLAPVAVASLTDFNPENISAPSHFLGNSRDSTLCKLSQEMIQLRSQVREMKQVMDASLQMQLEMQRTLSQQVSAVFAGILQSQSQSNSSSSSSSSSSPMILSHGMSFNPVRLPGKCVVCVDSDADVVFFKCGHQCTCFVCATSCQTRKQPCPICRAPIECFVRSFPV